MPNRFPSHSNKGKKIIQDILAPPRPEEADIGEDWNRRKEALKKEFQKFANQESIREEGTRDHLDTKFFNLRHQLQLDPHNLKVREAFASTEAQLEAYTKKKQDFQAIQAGLTTARAKTYPAVLLSQRVKARKEETFIQALEDPQGTLSTDQKKMLQTTTEFYTNLFNKPATVPLLEEVFHPPHLRLPEERGRELDLPFTDEEIKSAIHRLKPNRSPGPDGLPGEVFKQDPDIIVPHVQELLKLVLYQKTPPEGFTNAITKLLPKDGPSPKLAKYRPISLLDTSYKVIASMMAQRLKPILPEIIHPDQSGFVMGRNIAQTVRELVDLVDAAGHAAFPLTLMMIDFEKAYDTMRRDFIYKSMRHLGIPPTFVSWTKALLANTSTQVAVNGFLTPQIHQTTGVRQGCPMAPFLFVIGQDIVLNFLRASPITGIPRPLGDRKLTISYVDDTTLTLSGPDQIPIAAAVLEKIAGPSGLHANPAKTQIIPVWTPGMLVSQYSGCFSVVPRGQSTRVLGFRVSATGVTKPTWTLCLSRLLKDIAKWNGWRLANYAKTQVVNIFLTSTFLYQAQVVPPPPDIAKKILRELWAFLGSQRSHLRLNQAAYFALYSQATILAPREAGGLGVKHPLFRAASFAANWIYKLLNADKMGWKSALIANWEAETSSEVEDEEPTARMPLGIHTFLAHPCILKSPLLQMPADWRAFFQAFLETRPLVKEPPLQCLPLLEEYVCFNRFIISPPPSSERRRGSGSWDKPFGTRSPHAFLYWEKVQLKHLFIEVEDGTGLFRPLSQAELLSSELFGRERGLARCRVARQVLAALPTTWTDTLTRVQMPSQRRPEDHMGAPPWLPGQELTEDTGRGTALGERLEPGRPSTNDLYKRMFEAADIDFQSQHSWNSKVNFQIHWDQVRKDLNHPLVPLICKDVILRIYTRTIQVSSRMCFLPEEERQCKRCNEREDIEHCFFSCQAIFQVSQILQSFLWKYYKHVIREPYEALFLTVPRKTALPWILFRNITLRHLWLHRCAAGQGNSKPGRVLINAIITEFQLTVQRLFLSVYQSKQPRDVKLFAELRILFTIEVACFKIPRGSKTPTPIFKWSRLSPLMAETPPLTGLEDIDEEPPNPAAEERWPEDMGSQGASQQV